MTAFSFRPIGGRKLTSAMRTVKGFGSRQTVDDGLFVVNLEHKVIVLSGLLCFPSLDVYSISYRCGKVKLNLCKLSRPGRLVYTALIKSSQLSCNHEAT